jgi:hypothetical protein
MIRLIILLTFHLLRLSQRAFIVIYNIIIFISVPYIWLLRIINGNPKGRLAYFSLTWTILWVFLIFGKIGALMAKNFFKCLKNKKNQRIVLTDLN